LDLEFWLSLTGVDVGDDKHHGGARSAGTRKLAIICGSDGDPGSKGTATGCRTRYGKNDDGTGGDDSAPTCGGTLGESLELVGLGTIWGIKGSLQPVATLKTHASMRSHNTMDVIDV
jgi:hypothetical protein